MKKQKLSYFLIPGSLLLLASFLGYWLYGAYQKEEQQLKVEIERTIVDAKRAIQDSLMQQLFNIPFKDLGFNKKFKDSIHITQNHPHLQGRTEIQILTSTDELDSIGFSAVKQMLRSNDPKELQANISVVMDQDLDGVYPTERNQEFTKLILDKVIQEIHLSTLPKEFSIANKDSLESSQNNIVIEVFNAKNPENYVANFEGIRWHLLKKIYPQVLFSIFLFSITCLAFYLVHQSLQEQKKLLAMKNNFISNMTHELKTPISTIGVAIEAMQDFNVLKEPEKAKEYLSFSKKELNRLSLLVEKVLNMAQFEKGNYALKKEAVDLNQLISKVVNSMQLQLEKANANLVKNYNEEQSYIVYADPVHLSNVFYNLIDNSIKYSTNPAQISIDMNEEQDKIVLRFSDRGIGIPKAFQDRVFDQFFRVPAGNVHNVKGHGLGLSYIAEIIQKHHGTIELESEEAVGTSFNISLAKHEA